MQNYKKNINTQNNNKKIILFNKKSCALRIITLPLHIINNSKCTYMEKGKEQFIRLVSCLVIVFSVITLSSCDDDEIAQTLDGIWEGEVAKDFFSHRWGTQKEYYAVDMEFYADPYRYAQGTGVEYDYLYNGDYTPCRFRFEVQNGIIYIDYDDDTHVAIRDYHLSNNHFSGVFIDYYSGYEIATFDFVKVTNWRHDRSYRSGDEKPKEVPSPATTK